EFGVTLDASSTVVKLERPTEQLVDAAIIDCMATEAEGWSTLQLLPERTAPDAPEHEAEKAVAEAERRSFQFRLEYTPADQAGAPPPGAPGTTPPGTPAPGMPGTLTGVDKPAPTQGVRVPQRPTPDKQPIQKQPSREGT